MCSFVVFTGCHLSFEVLLISLNLLEEGEADFLDPADNFLLSYFTADDLSHHTSLQITCFIFLQSRRCFLTFSPWMKSALSLIRDQRHSLQPFFRCFGCLRAFWTLWNMIWGFCFALCNNMCSKSSFIRLCVFRLVFVFVSLSVVDCWLVYNIVM